MLFSAQAGEGGKTSFVAHGCGVHGRSWGAFCGGVEEDAHVLVCKEKVQERMVIIEITLIHKLGMGKSRRVGWWRYSRGVLHHPAPLDLHPLQHLVLMKPLHRGPQCRHMVCQGLVVRWQVLGQWGTWAREVVGRQRSGRGRGHGVAWGVGWQWWVKGVDSVGNDIIALWRGLRCKLGVSVGMRTGGGGLMMQWAC